MKVAEALGAIRPELLVEFSARASQADHLPVARWISRVLVRELARRDGEAIRPVAPLELQEGDVPFAIEWCGFAARQYVEAGLDLGDRDMVLLAAFVDHIGMLVKQRTPPH